MRRMPEIRNGDALVTELEKMIGRMIIHQTKHTKAAVECDKTAMALIELAKVETTSHWCRELQQIVAGAKAFLRTADQE